jgi:phenylpropionate dioxygenase-like ring-hydroxylating dioxygenase large terminal subunit
MDEPAPDVVSRFFHPVLAARKLRKAPVRVEVAGRAYVLFRDHTGRAAALRDRCPHRFAPLSAGRVAPDGRLTCAYHGWNFDAEGRGRSPSQPTLARCDVASFQLLEAYDYLWLAGREVPAAALPEMAWAREGYEPAGSFTALFRAPLHVALDNFCEDEHTPWVHTRLGWTADDAGAIAFEARNHDDRTEVVYRARQRDSLLARVLLLRPGDVFNNEWVTRFDPVRTVYEIYWTDPHTRARRPIVTRSAIFFVPETATTTRFHVFVWARMLDPRYAWLMPVLKRAALGLGWAEVEDDRRFIPTVADTPLSMKGMRLGRFDKPLVHNHRLLARIYYGAGSPDAPGLESEQHGLEAERDAERAEHPGADRVRQRE